MAGNGGGRQLDYDYDGLGNLLDLDADHDGYADALEVYYGSDPSDPQSRPLLTDLVETGEVTVDHTWKRVKLRVPFLDPVVVAKPLSRNQAAPAVVRLRRVTPGSFELRVQEWDYLDGPHVPETVGYLVMERGAYTLADGTRVEAGQVEADWTRFGTVVFSQPFTRLPVVLTAVASARGADAVTTRVRRVTRQGFEVRLQEQERNAPVHARETLSYIAWEPSRGTLDGVTFAVGRTLTGVGHRFALVPFPALFGGAVPVFLADMQTVNEGNVATLRWRNKTGAGVEVQVQEERSLDQETAHLGDTIGYVLIMRQP
jgi:hypothetical protein